MSESKKQTIQERFSIVEGDITLSTLSDNAYRIYGALRLYTMGKDACWPSVQTLAAHLGKSKATIQRGLKELAEKRAEFDDKPVICITQSWDAKGRRKPNRYEIWPEHNVTTTVKSDDEDNHANLHSGPGGTAENRVDNSEPPSKSEPDNHANLHEKAPPNIIEEKKKEEKTSACSEPSASPVEGSTPTRSQISVEGKENSQRRRYGEGPIDLSRLDRMALTPYWNKARDGDPATLALFQSAPPSLKNSLAHEYHCRQGRPLDWDAVAPLEN